MSKSTFLKILKRSKSIAQFKKKKKQLFQILRGKNKKKISCLHITLTKISSFFFFSSQYNYKIHHLISVQELNDKFSTKGFTAQRSKLQYSQFETIYKYFPQNTQNPHKNF